MDDAIRTSANPLEVIASNGLLWSTSQPTDGNERSNSSMPTTTFYYKDELLWMHTEIILMALFYGFAFILGAIGNGLIIYIVAHYARMRTLCNVFLASLATADLLLVCVCIPVKLVQLLTYTWTLGDLTCKLLHYIQNVSAFCSVLTLTTMSIERYYAILHPMECRTTFSMHHIQKIICLIWILSLIMSIPAFYLYVLVPIGDPALHMNHFYWCVKISNHWDGNTDGWIRVTYEVYMMCTILFIPTLIMTYTYCRICTHLWSIVHRRTAIRYGNGTTVNESIKTSKNGPKNGSETCKSTASVSSSSGSGSNSSGVITSSTTKLHQQRTMEEDNQTVKQVIKMLVAVVLLFVICWSPLLIINLLKGFLIIPQINEGLLKAAVPIAYLLAYLNSVVNPFIYGFMSKNFRLYFKQVLNQCWSATCTRNGVGSAGPINRPIYNNHHHLNHQNHGSNKSDQQMKQQRTSAIIVRMNQFDLNQNQTQSNLFKQDSREQVNEINNRKPSDPRTEEVSIADFEEQIN
ncbi:hypothetical protein BLOT_004530 [Blomia tropicalis]|nr:hypothetical protein BLOT_004530 [Blomia tropicalis]